MGFGSVFRFSCQNVLKTHFPQPDNKAFKHVSQLNEDGAAVADDK